MAAWRGDGGGTEGVWTCRGVCDHNTCSQVRRPLDHAHPLRAPQHPHPPETRTTKPSTCSRGGGGVAGGLASAADSHFQIAPPLPAATSCEAGRQHL